MVNYNQNQINAVIKEIYRERNSMAVIKSITEDKIYYNNGKFDFYKVEGDMIYFKSCTGYKLQEKLISSYIK
ncbi:MAG: hypothetical protein ACRCTZ_20265 [Sarcina sp.]